MKADQAHSTHVAQVRRAEPSDAFVLAALELQSNREQGREGESGFLERFADAWLAERNRRPAWVAMTGGGQPLGAMTLYVVDDLPRPGRLSRPWMHISSLYVAQRARRTGVGERLLSTGVAWCRQNGAAWIQLSSDPTRTSLFRRAGFTTADPDLFRLRLK
ncbi:GNAT family N-acetyltransferase [Austwickia chelonae]|uniref:GNAT family N-acetyltransferase n=1 Tax=Austwickia chelonae TaxID=100225 RepID=UPI000E26B00D|nr:GNAT family N-acetyltransferase [Austwickia chelonae]